MACPSKPDSVTEPDASGRSRRPLVAHRRAQRFGVFSTVPAADGSWPFPPKKRTVEKTLCTTTVDNQGHFRRCPVPRAVEGAGGRSTAGSRPVVPSADSPGGIRGPGLDRGSRPAGFGSSQ